MRHFGAMPPNHCFCPPPKKEMCTPPPQARIVSQKKITGLVQPECILRPVPSLSTACSPTHKREYSLHQEQKTQVNAKMKPKFSCQKPFFVFGLHPLICGQEPRSAPQNSVASRQAINVPLRARIALRKEANDPYPQGVIWDEDPFFFVFTSEFEEKIHLCLFNYFFCPSLTLFWRRACFKCQCIMSLSVRCGVLEDVLGLENVLVDTF